MNTLCWWLAERVSRLLDLDERDAVCGDLRESDESGLRALLGLAGLVARRQAALWRDWPPWPALVGLVPLGFMLTRQSAGLAYRSAIYLWLYVDNWRIADAANSGYWRLMAEVSGPVLLSGFLLMVRSWAGGMAIGVLARRTTPVSGVIFCVALALADVARAPRFAPVGPNAGVFALTFYRAIYPLIVQIILVMLPALWGMILGRRGIAFSRGFRGFSRG